MKSGRCHERAPGADLSRGVGQASISCRKQSLPCQTLDGGASKPPEKAADTLQSISLNLVHFPLP